MTEGCGIGALRRRISEELAGLDSPRLEADILLSHFLGKNRAFLHAHPEYVPNRAELAAIESAVSRRRAREPLQYIIGKCTFDGLEIGVSKGCLVPRPETELLVQCAAENFPGGAFLDWGTGTGCIAIALLNRFPEAFAYMAEKNPDSIACASENLRKFAVTSRAKLFKSEAPDDIGGFRVSMIVSNPPYIPSHEIDSLMPEVSEWEPRVALDGGEDGLAPYAGLFALARRVLLDGGVLCVEYGGKSQTEALRSLAPGCFEEICALRDLSGCDRVLAWKMRKSAGQKENENGRV